MMRSSVSALSFPSLSPERKRGWAFGWSTRSVTWMLQIGLFDFGVSGLPFSKLGLPPTGLRPWDF